MRENFYLTAQTRTGTCHVMKKEEIEQLAGRQRLFFAGGKTREFYFRREQLLLLRTLIEKNEGRIVEALSADLKRSPGESFFAELLLLKAELNGAIACLRAWMKPEHVPTPLSLSPGSSRIVPEPYGNVLVIAPWNYPLLLLFSPLIGAMAAGNCIIIKPSEVSSHTSSLVGSLVKEHFNPDYLAVVEGGAEETRALLTLRFDYIFYTGSTAVGRIVMEAASRHLTPVTLELGGKSPCVVDRDVDVKIAARRIAWGKFMNAGQTCVAPDFLLVHHSMKDDLVREISCSIKDFYGDDPRKSPDYARIISDRHFKRLTALLGGGRIAAGGEAVQEERYIAPTVLEGISWESAIMEEEIFGPLLPVLTYETVEEVIGRLRERPKPLALYVFSRRRDFVEKVTGETSSGGVCINDTIVHLASKHLPFGGVGESGMGSYRGKKTFDTFSHRKSILERSTALDPLFRYPPYGTLKESFRKLLTWLSS